VRFFCPELMEGELAPSPSPAGGDKVTAGWETERPALSKPYTESGTILSAMPMKARTVKSLLSER
jgi:hypothetical protein